MTLGNKGNTQVTAGGAVRSSSRELFLVSLPDVDHPDQLFGHEPQRERVQKEGEDTEHHLTSNQGQHTRTVIKLFPELGHPELSQYICLPVAAHYRTPKWTRFGARPESSSFLDSLKTSVRNEVDQKNAALSVNTSYSHSGRITIEQILIQ